MRVKDFRPLQKGLLTTLPGFAICGTLVVEAPIKQVLRGLLFDSHSYDKSYFYVFAFFLPLCVPDSDLSLNFSIRLESPGRTPWQGPSKTIHADLIHAVRREALPFLADTDTALGLARKAKALGYSDNHHGAQSIALAYARAGMVNEAVAEIDDLLPRIKGNYPWEIEIRDRVSAFRNLLLADPEAAQRQLDEWELETARNLGLEAFLENHRQNRIP